MATIGTPFSPGMMQALLTKSEGAANRNLQAAQSDRQNRIQVDTANAGIAQQNIRNQMAAEQAAMGAKTNKAQIEMMKEQGRNERAERQNQLKQALEESKLELREGEAASKHALRSASVDMKKLDLLLAQKTFESDVERRKAEARYAAAKGDTEGLKKQVLATQAALNRERAEDMRKTRDVRIASIDAQGKNYLNLIEDRDIRRQLAQNINDFNSAFKEKNFNLSMRKMEIALNEYLSTTNIYNQLPAERGGGNMAAATALQDLAQMMGLQLDNAIKTGSHDPAKGNRVKPKGQPKGVGSAADDAGGVFD